MLLLEGPQRPSAEVLMFLIQRKFESRLKKVTFPL